MKSPAAKRLGFLFSLMAMAAGAVWGQTAYTWNLAGNGSWDVATNWSPNGVPGTVVSDTVTINTPYTVTMASAKTIAGIVLSSTAEVDVNGNNLTVNGPASLASTNATADITNGSTTSSTLTFGGTVTLGAATTFLQGANGTLNLFFNGTVNGAFDLLLSATGSRVVAATATAAIGAITPIANISISGASTLAMGSNDLHMTGSLTRSNSAGISSSANLFLEGTGTSAIDTTGSTFTNMVVAKTGGGQVSPSAALTLAGNLTLTSGTLSMANLALNIAGNMSVGTGILSSIGTITFNGSTVQALDFTNASIASATLIFAQTGVGTATASPAVSVSDVQFTSAATCSTSFSGALNSTSISAITANAQAIALNGGGTITNAVTFANTGPLTIGGAMTFSNGATATAPSSKSLSGTIIATAGNLLFGTTASTLTGSTILQANAGAAYVTLGAIGGSGNGLSIHGGTGATAVSGDIGSSGARLTTVTADVTAGGSLALQSVYTSGAQSLGFATAASTTLNGAAYDTSLAVGAGISLAGPVLLGTGITFTTAGSNLSFGSTINGAQALAFATGAGSITTSGAIGASTAPTGITLTSGAWTLGGTLATSGDLALSGGSLDVSAGNFAISLGGNLTGGGSFVAQAGTVTFTGTAAQTAASYTYYAVVANKTGGSLTMTSPTMTSLATGAGKAFALSLAGGGSVANAVTLDNTGALTISAGFAFSGGVSAIGTPGTNCPATFDLAGLLSAAGAGVLNFGTIPVSVTGSATAGGASTGQITLGAISIADGATLSLGAGASTPVSIGAISSGAYTLGAGLTIATAGTVTAGGAITLTGDLTLSSGTLDLAGQALTLGGNWNGSGGSFTASAGTVTFNGTSTSVISGSNSFATLQCTTAGKFLSFTAGTTQIVATFTIAGGPLSPITLQSSSSGSAWFINVTTTATVSYAEVKDSNATTAISATSSKDLGGNTNWTFPASTLTWTGTTSTDWNTSTNWSPAYVPNTTDNVTVPDTSLGSNRYPTLAAATTINNLTLGSAVSTLDLNGFLLTVNGTFANSGSLLLTGNESTPVGLGATVPGTVVYKGTTAGLSLAGLTSFTNLTINGASGTFTPAVGTVAVSGALTISAGTLAIPAAMTMSSADLTVNGGTLDFVGTPTAFSTGNLSHSSGTIANTATNTITVSGNLSVSGTFSTPLNSTIDMSGTGTINTAVQIGNLTVVSGAAPVVTVATSALNLAGTLDVQNGTSLTDATSNLGMTVAGAMTLAGTMSGGSGTDSFAAVGGAGTFNATSGTSTISGNLSVTTFNHDNGTVVFTGGSQNGYTFNNVTINGTVSASGGGAGAWTLLGSLTRTSGSLDMVANSLNIRGDIVYTAGSLNSSGTVTIDGTAAPQAIDFSGATLANLTINNTWSTPTVSAGSAISLSGTLTVTSGNLVLGANALTVSGPSSVTGTLTGGSALVTLTGAVNGSGTFDVGAGGMTFGTTYGATTSTGSFNMQGTGNLSFTGNAILSGTVTGNATVGQNPSIIFLANATWTGASFTANGDVVAFQGGAAQTFTTGGLASYGPLSIAKTVGTTVTSSGNLTATSLTVTTGTFAVAIADTLTVSGSTAVNGGTLTLTGAYAGGGATFG
ncbi:MAG TPA: hypothetical protein VMV83_12665, partial [Rectinemataceae bacterium]|nr:hypothetical protein [Rectinemataceae bacterium]